MHVPALELDGFEVGLQQLLFLFGEESVSGVELTELLVFEGQQFLFLLLDGGDEVVYILVGFFLF